MTVGGLSAQRDHAILVRVSRAPLVRLDAGGPRRILIYAVTGSGKTTLARRLSGISGLPWHSVDDEIGWEPGAITPWTNRPDNEQMTLAVELCAQDEWILDTAYQSWRGVVLARSELVVALDYPRWISLLRLVRRTVARMIDHRLICNGNVETFRSTFSSDSILFWHVRSFAGKRREIGQLLDDPLAPPTLRFTHPRDLERWLGASEHPVV